MPGEADQFVFAYGSLVSDLAHQNGTGEVRAARLRDHRRGWNVAMDNAVTLPDYKYYLDASDRSRPAVLVTFLNLLPEPGHAVNGILVPVDAARLRELDRRERNYQRREVTDAIEAFPGAGAAPGAQPAPSRVWAYFGRPEACLRFEDGRRTGRAVIDKAYLDRVHAGFAALGGGAGAEFERSTEPHGCRVLELTCVAVG